MMWARHVAGMEEMKNTHITTNIKHKVKRPFGRLKRKLKYILKKCDMWGLTGYVWLRIVTSRGLL